MLISNNDNQISILQMLNEEAINRDFEHIVNPRIRRSKIKAKTLKILHICAVHPTPETRKQQNSYLKKLINSVKQGGFFDSYLITNMDMLMRIVKVHLFSMRNQDPKYMISLEGVQMPKFQAKGLQNYPECMQLFVNLLVHESASVKALKVYFTRPFLSGFFDLFKSEQKDRVQFLLYILTRFYAKLVPRRKIIRTIMFEKLEEAAEQNNYYVGLSMILRQLCSVASGYARPLRQEHIQSFHQYVLPMFKLDQFHLMEEQYRRYIQIYTSHDPILLVLVAKAMLKYWPEYNYQKQVVFLSMIGEFIEIYHFWENQKMMRQILKKILNSLQHEHFLVSKRALAVLSQDCFQYWFKMYKQEFLGDLCRILHEQKESYWYEGSRPEFEAQLKRFQHYFMEDYEKLNK